MCKSVQSQRGELMKESTTNLQLAEKGQGPLVGNSQKKNTTYFTGKCSRYNVKRRKKLWYIEKNNFQSPKVNSNDSREVGFHTLFTDYGMGSQATTGHSLVEPH